MDSQRPAGSSPGLSYTPHGERAAFAGGEPGIADVDLESSSDVVDLRGEASDCLACRRNIARVNNAEPLTAPTDMYPLFGRNLSQIMLQRRYWRLKAWVCDGHNSGCGRRYCTYEVFVQGFDGAYGWLGVNPQLAQSQGASLDPADHGAQADLEVVTGYGSHMATVYRQPTTNYMDSYEHDQMSHDPWSGPRREYSADFSGALGSEPAQPSTSASHEVQPNVPDMLASAGLASLDRNASRRRRNLGPNYGYMRGHGVCTDCKLRKRRCSPSHPR